MTVAALLAELRARDIQVSADGDRLRCNAPAGTMTPELRTQLQERKSEILAFLQSAEALTRQQPAIVPLQPHGSRAPVFAVAGHNGDVFCYREFAQHLGSDQPFYGLEPPGLDGQSEPLTSVEELAAYFAQQIRAFHPEGPCVIAGYCAGGTIAFELARQLQKGGVVINFLVLFGSPYATMYRPLPQLQFRLMHVKTRVATHARALASRSWRERRRYISEHLRKRAAAGDAADAPEVDTVMMVRGKIEHATTRAIRHYTPAMFGGRLALILPFQGWRPEVAPLRWRKLVEHTVEYFGPAGCHVDTMLREPFAATFADLFVRCRDANLL